MGAKQLEEPQKSDTLWTSKEATLFFKVSRAKLTLMVANDGLPHFRIGGQLRFIPEQLWAWAKKQTKA